MMTRHYLEILGETIRSNWDAPALTDYDALVDGSGLSYTYGEMYQKIQWLCARFSHLELKPGDHIAICGANSANWVIAYLSIAAFQGVSVTVLHTQTSEEIYKQIAFSDAKALFVDEEIWETLKPCSFSQLKWIFSLENLSIFQPEACFYDSEFYANELSNDELFTIGSIDALATICFTSGSTALAKGVMLSYRNISANILDAVPTFPDCKNKCMISLLPFAHAYGILGEVLSQLPNAHHIYILGPKISFDQIVKAYQSIRPYAMVTVPFIVEKLWNSFHERICEALGNNIKQLTIGGSLFDHEIENNLLKNKFPFSVGYGVTEAGPLIGADLWQNYVPHSGGHIVPTLEARISSEGEILVRGENVMLGYYKDPEATRKKIDPDGWLHTGDEGHLDAEGTLFVHGRLNSDMIVLPSGENVSPVKIESVINQQNGVEESLVLLRKSQLVALVYVSGEHADRKSILSAVNSHLPLFSQLCDLEFVDIPFQKTEKQTIKRYLYK